jgi:outer membrane protein assembly factor BamB
LLSLDNRLKDWIINAIMDRSDFPSGVAMSLIAVIPSVIILGPIALLAAVLSAVLGRVHGGLRRWSLLLAIAAVDAGLYLVHFAFREDWRESWLGSPFTLWMVLASSTLTGALWSWMSSRRETPSERSAHSRPGRGALIGVGMIGLLGLGVVLRSHEEGYPLFHPSLVIWATAWLSAAYLLSVRLLGSRYGSVRLLMPAPAAILGTLALSCGLFGATTLCRDYALIWSFPAEDKGNILSRPLVSGERVFVTVAMNGGGGDARWGVVYGLDRTTGEKKWSFTDDRQLHPVRSSVCLAGELLYFGDGLADSKEGSLYCLEAATGKKRWQFRTAAPVSSDPCVCGEKVFFSAGGEGVFCLDAITGTKVWQFGEIQNCCGPTICGSSLYAGAQRELFCLDVTKGQLIWRKPIDLRVQSVTTSGDERLFVSLGNGTLMQSAEQPAGALVCLEARTGRQRWRYDVADGVLAEPTLHEAKVYFASRDRHCYSLDVDQGELRWACELDSPIVTTPALAGPYLLVNSSQGIVYRLRADTGASADRYDVARYTRTKPWLFSSPTVAEGQVYFGAGLDDFLGGMVPRLYCVKADLGRG